MTSTIAIASEVQSAGELLNADSGGGPKSTQIDAALQNARLEMIELVTKALYEEVRLYSGTDVDLKERKQVFKDAEARFALAHLPEILRSAQMTEKGLVTESEVGKAITRYGEIKESLAYEVYHRMQANLILAPYLDHVFLNDDDDEVGMCSNDGSIGMYVM